MKLTAIVIHCGRLGVLDRYAPQMLSSYKNVILSSSSCLILDSIVVSISACHAEDPGSIPGRGGEHFFFSFSLSLFSLLVHDFFLTHFFLQILVIIMQADCILLLGLAEKGPKDSAMGQVCYTIPSLL